MKNIFYFYSLSAVGGTENFLYQIAKKYKAYDITIYYKFADAGQLARLKQYVRCIQYSGEKIECEKAFFNYNADIINNVTANEYIQVIHADYKGIPFRRNPKITKYIAVSKLAAKSFKEVSGIEAEVIYNPCELEKPKRVLNLISATRLTAEKGKKRMIKFAEILDRENIPYLWTIFTNDTKAIDNKNIIYMQPRLDIIDYIANADYLVQLSDSEAYCYSVVEALIVGTPVIVTDMPVMKEIGLNKTNSFILDFDMQNVPVKEIYESRLQFEYTSKKDTWNKELAKGKSTYRNYRVTATKAYEEFEVKDGGLGFIPKAGYEFIIDEYRLKQLQEQGEKKGKPFIEVLD